MVKKSLKGGVRECVRKAMSANSSFFLHKKFTMKSKHQFKMCNLVLIAPYLFGFEVSEKRVVQRVQVFVSKEITKSLFIIEPQLFFFARSKSVLKMC